MQNDQLMQMIKAVCLTGRELNASSSKCDNSPYRQIDGHCNNVQTPEWGANYSPFQRALPPDYADGLSPNQPLDLKPIS